MTDKPKPLTAFELGRDLYEARIRAAWNFGDKGEARLALHPYPRHPADANPYSQDCAEIQLAQAQANAIFKKYTLVIKE